MKKLMLKVLKKTVKYYSEDTYRRSCNYDEYCSYYSEEDHIVKRDSIGRLCTKANAKKLQEESLGGSLEFCVTSIDDFEIHTYLKDKYKNLPVKFLIDLQELHDCVWYWDMNMLSEKGRLFAKKIKKNIKNKY